MSEKKSGSLSPALIVALTVMTVVLIVCIVVVVCLQLRVPTMLLKLFDRDSGEGSVSLPMPYRAEVKEASEKYGVEEARIYAVIQTESSFRPTVVSPSGAVGLMQMLPETYEEQCMKRGVAYNKDDLKDPAVNIDFCTEYLAYLYSLFGNWDNAHMAYHAGPGNVRAWLEDPECSADGERVDRIPSAATAKYLERINAARAAYAVAIRSEEQKAAEEQKKEERAAAQSVLSGIRTGNIRYLFCPEYGPETHGICFVRNTDRK